MTHPEPAGAGDADPGLRIAARFCGPPATGNGGYVAGLLAAHAGAPGALEVTLRRPTPLETPLRIARADAPGAIRWVLATEDGTCVAKATPAAPLAEAPPLIPDAAALAAGAPIPSDHPFPRCFVCGPARAPGDGLCIHPVALAGGALVAAPWTPDADLAGTDGRVALPFVWAALDCPGYFALHPAGGLRPMLLGRITARVEAPVRAGLPHRVLGWALGREGRRHSAATALVDPAGRIVARSRQLWFEVPSAT